MKYSINLWKSCKSLEILKFIYKKKERKKGKKEPSQSLQVHYHVSSSSRSACDVYKASREFLKLLKQLQQRHINILFNKQSFALWDHILSGTHTLYIKQQLISHEACHFLLKGKLNYSVCSAATHLAVLDISPAWRPIIVVIN